MSAEGKIPQSSLMRGQENCTWKKYLVYVFLFFTFAFPKAGAIIKGAPITISTILCGITVLCILPEILSYGINHLGVTGYYFLYVVFVMANAILSLGNIPLKELLMAMVVACSPIVYLIGKSIAYEDCMKILSIAGIIIGLYSIAQWLFGLTQTTIPGITLALGDAWANKPIGYGFSQLHEATKMPSTTQNGNNVALLSVLGIGSLLSWMPKQIWSKMKWASVCLLFVALIFSGSRSANYPFVILSPIGIYGYFKVYSHAEKSQKKAFAFTTVVTLLLVIILLHLPQLTKLANAPNLPENPSSSSATEDPFSPSDGQSHVPDIQDQTRLLQAVGNMSGRIDMWKSMWNKLSEEYVYTDWIRLIFIGANNGDRMMGCEGLPLFISQYGVLPALLFMGLFIPLLFLFKQPFFLWSGFAFAGALVVDSSYNYPPILIWFFILLGTFFKENQKGGEKVNKDEENNNLL